MTLSQAPPCSGTNCNRAGPAATAPARQLHANVRKRSHRRAIEQSTNCARGSAPRSTHRVAPAAISPAVGDCGAPRANTAASPKGRSPSPRGSHTATGFRLLTPAHHLRGAAQNGRLSAKMEPLSAPSRAVAAPRLVHALVRWQTVRMTMAAIRSAKRRSQPPGR